MKTAARWIRRLLDLALILLVVSVLGLVLAVNVGPRFGHQLVVIRGGSMEPAIHLGSVTLVSPVQPADLHPGDVVTLKESNGVIVSHRITRIVQESGGLFIETKGDANPTVDPVLSPVAQVTGRVDLTIPGLGYLLYLLTLPIGVFSILGLALTLLFAIWLLEDLESEPDEVIEEAMDHMAYESELARVLDARQSHQPSD
jgi:signal peptidase I